MPQAIHNPLCNEPIANGLVDWWFTQRSITAGQMVVSDLAQLGSSVDTTEFQTSAHYHEVHSSLTGGTAAPIDQLYLGQTTKFVIELSTWDQEKLDKLRSFANDVLGDDNPDRLGSPMLRNHSFRIVCSTAVPARSRNFPFCLIQKPISCGYGTKWASWKIPVTVYKTPEWYDAVLNPEFDREVGQIENTSLADPNDE
jgi:hypothetical protein